MKFIVTGLGIRRARAALATFGVILLAACTSAAQASPYVMFRDPQCGCCGEWAKHVRTGLDHEVTVREDRPMAEVKADAGVPDDLISCHTMEVDGYVIEGHVPAREIARLLEERPDGVTGHKGSCRGLRQGSRARSAIRSRAKEAPKLRACETAQGKGGRNPHKADS